MSDPISKGKAMRKKTEEIRKLFNLPETEQLIQNYSCALVNPLPIQGNIYVSQNYACFQASIASTNEVIPFRKVVDIKKENTLLVIPNAISITTNDKNYWFGSFLHRDEAYNLLHHLWKHPPSYIVLEEERKAAAAAPPSIPSSAPQSDAEQRSTNRAFGRAGGFDSDGGLMSSGGRTFGGGASSSTNYGGSSMQQTTQVKVDVEASRNALRIAQEAKEMGVATMVELTVQAETLDKIERSVENTINNLDKGDRLLKSIESVGGALSNALSKDKTGNYRAPEGQDRTLTVKKEKAPDVEIEILHKQKNDALTQAILRFGEEKFVCVDAVSKKVEKGCTYNYSDIESIVMRARPQHMDIRFKGKTPRFRLMSSYLQLISNELILRTGPKQVKVIFEPNSREFQYGSFAISQAPKSTSRDAANGGLFFRRQVKTSALLSDNASQQLKDDLDQQDKDLDEIGNIIGDLKGIAVTVGQELDRQNEQLDRVDKRVDYANERMFKSTQRVDRLL